MRPEHIPAKTTKRHDIPPYVNHQKETNSKFDAAEGAAAAFNKIVSSVAALTGCICRPSTLLQRFCAAPCVRTIQEVEPD